MDSCTRNITISPIQWNVSCVLTKIKQWIGVIPVKRIFVAFASCSTKRFGMLWNMTSFHCVQFSDFCKLRGSSMHVWIIWRKKHVLYLAHYVNIYFCPWYINFFYNLISSYIHVNSRVNFPVSEALNLTLIRIWNQTKYRLHCSWYLKKNVVSNGLNRYM